jgi:hypothetical protein
MGSLAKACYEMEDEITPEQLERHKKRVEEDDKRVTEYMESDNFKRLVELRKKYADLRELEKLEKELEYRILHKNYYTSDEIKEKTKEGL